MDLVLSVVGFVASLTSFVCFVIVVVKMFQNKQTGLGVASIIGIFCLIGYFIALFVGWKNKTAWNLEKVMPIFAIAFVVTLITTGARVASMLSQGLPDPGSVSSDFGGDMEVPEITSE